jgi:hypothetical protein
LRSNKAGQKRDGDSGLDEHPDRFGVGLGGMRGADDSIDVSREGDGLMLWDGSRIMGIGERDGRLGERAGVRCEARCGELGGWEAASGKYRRETSV